ncbi:hypothetical protein ASE63_22400 [Bosea sp. Root381]|uniref:hypothetical protein n=1 Tax=Bosea sp. Root381 TaxID=1736524 RepID=UPI0006F84591|nr:hypothetical protein [Bosea sp. Root381]KRE07453.1 hypothetical protein ASE63_22400 [Bosea sp. Root381]
MSLFALAGLAVDIAATPHTLRTWPAGSYVEGKWTQGDGVEAPIRAIMQAPSARDLESLPEGERTEGLVTVWSRTPLNSADEDDRTRADEVMNARGEAYRVVKAQDRAEGGFYRAIARLITHDRGRSVPEPVELP